jgi:hypothetical protein
MKEKTPYFSKEDNKFLISFYKKKPLEKALELIYDPCMSVEAVETILVSLRGMFVDDDKFLALVKM